MFVQDSYQLNSPLFDSTSFIPANYNHFKFNLTSEHHLNIPYGMYIIPFQNNNITFEQLLMELLMMLHLEKEYNIKKIKLSLKSGYIVDYFKTAEDLRVELCRDSASGITLQAKIMGNIVDEAAVVFHVANEPDFNKQRFNKWFLLLNNQTPFYISITKNITFEKLQEAVVGALNGQYKNGINKDHLSFYKVKKTTEEIVFNWEKDGKKIFNKQVSQIIQKQTITIIGVEVIKEDADWPQSNVASEEYLIFHISNDNQIKLRFSHIVNYTVQELLQYLKIEHTNTLGIKIVDEIFAPHQLIKDASGYFKYGQGTFAKNIECRLVSEKEMFYSQMSKINEEFHIKKDMVTKEKEAQFQKCREKCKDIIQRQYQQSEIKEEKEIQVIAPNPITLYTSSVEVIDPQSHSSNLLYRCLNQQLRTVSFGTNQDLVKSWKYKFAATLIKSLKETKIFEGLVYRGIRGHQLKGDVDQLYVAKEFISASKIKQKAQNFTKQANPNIGTMITIHSLRGREIKQYSMYQKEEEVLFMPYTYFRIIEKDDSGSIYKMTLRELQEKQYKCNPSIQILWVDDKVKEGEKVISLLNCPMYTTFLRQFLSTQKLAEWIMQNPSKIANPSIKKIVISNMKRIQNEASVLDAGAQTVKLARREIPNCQIVLYIGHVEGTKENLIKNEIDVNSVLILSKRQHLREYLSNVCAPPEQVEEVEEVIFETQSTILKFFEPINSKESSFSKAN